MKQQIIDTASTFLTQIGVPVRVVAFTGETFQPGLNIVEGALCIDPERLLYPGDILHEAAHIALTPPSRRASLGGKLTITPAEEMAALAWSYAAAVSIGLDPLSVFHEGGYKNGGAHLAEQYASGLPPGGPGVPILQWWGMTTAFPQMKVWLRETEDPT
jgi:hypothetical protein